MKTERAFSPPSLAPSATEAGFAAFDDALLRLSPGDSQTPRALIAFSPDPNTELSALAHAERRLHARGFHIVHVRGRGGSATWVEAAAKLGVTASYTDPFALAQDIAIAMRARPTALLLRLPPPGTWEREVLAEVLRQGHAAFVLLTHSYDQADDLRGAVRCDLPSSLEAHEVKRWFEVLAEHALREAALSTDKQNSLPALEAHWSPSARLEATGSHLLPEHETLVQAMALVGRGWTNAELARFAEALGVVDASAVEQLHATGRLDFDQHWITVHERFVPDESANADFTRTVARALEETIPNEPLGLLRAAELYLSVGEVDSGDRTHALAMRRLRHPTLRRELMRRWMHALQKLAESERVVLYRRAAERSLLTGEADEATTWAELAARLAGDDLDVLILLAQSLTASGDLVAAKAALDRARIFPGASERAHLLSVEVAEVALRKGDLDEAVREATAPSEQRTNPAIALRARNILGKVLLARSAWEEADQHFASDVLLAASVGESTGELRARLNRGVTLLSRGLFDEARTLLEAVERDGQKLGNPAACAFAAENLAVIAMWRHEYGTALAYTERALEHMIQAGDRITMSLVLSNLAELRFKLGLYDHAEHAIAFGRRTLGPGMPPDVSAYFNVISARLALIRGNTQEAWREIREALSRAQTTKTPEAYLVATRLALEDGDIVRAKDSLACAGELASTEKVRGEVELLGAYLARARGEEFLPTAEAALHLATAVGEEELLREVHLLLFERYRSDNKPDLARAQLVHAEDLRDRVAGALAGEVRAAYLARQDVALLTSLRSELAEGEPEAMVASLAEVPSTRKPRHEVQRELVGEDPSIRALMHAIRKVATTDSTVLIHGESGTGKELVAEALHRASSRAQGPLVSVNCAALVETLLLSELFGHEKGSFTGAGGRRRGRFEVADNGTLFLDEIGDISPRTQVALLRVLQERTFERVGGTQPIKVNVRIVCATHRDLKMMVERGEFREDLYYRLRGIMLEVPPLRNRIGDLPLLCESLLARTAEEQHGIHHTMSPAALELLSRHRWPGNVRELENVLRVAGLFAESNVLSVKDFTENVEELRAIASRLSIPPPPFPLPPASLSSAPESTEGDPVEGEAPEEGGVIPTQESDATSMVYACMKHGQTSLSDIKRQIERDCIARALAETKGNITRAAALLGMKRPRLSQLVKQYGFGAVTEET